MQITSICLGTLPLPLITPFQTALRRTEAICDLEVDYNLCGYGEAPPTAVITMCDLDGPSLCKENPFIGGTSDKGPKIILGEKAGISLEGFPVRFEKVAGR